MKTCAFLTMEDLAGYVSDDQLAVEPFNERGWHVDFVPWTAGVDWSRYDAVLIRSTWDYHLHPVRFLQALERIDAATHLVNPLKIVRWNTRKTYLSDLADAGVDIVPTTFGRHPGPADLTAALSNFQTEKIIVKPVVSAGADRTFLLNRDMDDGDLATVAAAFAGEDYLAQPFIDSVLSEGEYSVFFFGGALSHAVVKTPKTSDFRVQEEHGGTIRKVEASAELEAAAARATGAVDPAPLYARVDLVRDDSKAWLIMELELIEPSLYLRTDPQAPARLAAAFDDWMHQAS